MADNEPGEEDFPEPDLKTSVRTGKFWFTETNRAFNYRTSRLVINLFTIYLSITVLGVIFVLLSFYFSEDDLYYVFMTLFAIGLCSYVPFVFIYFRLVRVKHLHFYAKGVLAESFLGQERFLIYREFRSLEKTGVKNIGKAYRLVHSSGNPMYKNILIRMEMEGAEEYAGKIEDAIERGPK